MSKQRTGDNGAVGNPVAFQPTLGDDWDVASGRESARSEKRKRCVISASKRTDIPAFYLPWLVERVKVGYVEVPNPLYRSQISRVSLKPEDVDGIVWWSKNYAVYLRPRFYEFFQERYRNQFFHFTINPRRPEWGWIEPDVPSEEEALDQVRRLVELRNEPKNVAWRYDPLVFWREAGENHSTWDPEFFARMCRALGEVGVRTCFTSIADPYRKFVDRVHRLRPDITLRVLASDKHLRSTRANRLDDLPVIEPDELRQIGEAMSSIAAKHGITVHSCSEPVLGEILGGGVGRCIDPARFGLSDGSPAHDQRMKGREGCACAMHRDIGDYVAQECGYSCVYCYANPNHKRFKRLKDEARRPVPVGSRGLESP